MAKRKSSNPTAELDTADYRHTGEKRTNIPPAKIAAEGKVPAVPKVKYHYNPHLPPVLRFDPTGKADKLPELLSEAQKRPLKYDEVMTLSEALRVAEPWLEWSAKREQHEKGFFEVDPVALHIHERVSAQAIVRQAQRKDVMRSLFADPEQPYEKAVQFYKHDVDWANRLILGDSLQVMSSLARRENLAGKVQMIYIDPPYGIKFGSNFQPEVGRKDVKDKDADLTREPEMVRAYRDTWHAGVHSYIAYIRDRLLVARSLLANAGSVFVQISDENVHHIREVMDEVFGRKNFVSLICFAKTSGLEAADRLSSSFDYLVWYARDASQLKYRPLWTKKSVETGGYNFVEETTGHRRRSGGAAQAGSGVRLLALSDLTKPGPGSNYEIDFDGIRFNPGARWWGTTPDAMKRLGQAGRLFVIGNSLRFVRYLDDFPVSALNNLWDDTGIAGFASDKRYVVETNAKVVERCVLMTSDPGDLVLDPTCGSGTTAVVCEQWGRRWITVDTSRVALSLARQRLLTAKFEHFKTRGVQGASFENPGAGFVYKSVPHVTLKSIAQNRNLDPLLSKNEPALESALVACTRALTAVTAAQRRTCSTKLQKKQAEEGKRSISDADRRRWDLPSAKFEHWTVPFDTDADWPRVLQDAVTAYRKAWRAKMDEVNKCIADNAEQEEIVDQPEVVKGVLRVSGPFTVEGVRPEELSLGEDGKFGGTPEGDADAEEPVEVTRPAADLVAYLTQMVQHLRRDGITFPNNKRTKLASLEPLFEAGTGGILHAEGRTEGRDGQEGAHLAVSFGPQYGPVTAEQVEEAIRAASRGGYDELVLAGFSFDATAAAVIQETKSPKLKAIHQAHIRPDVNPAMSGLLKDTPGSQLFTVFGQPEIDVPPPKDGKYVVKLKGVDIYDPVENTVRSSGADKVAAWFLDQDYDGRCFCTTQAFFPNQDAWEKIAKALGSSADEEAFEAFKGTESLPFAAGKHKRIAVKVVDPRGNEVMAVKPLKS